MSNASSLYGQEGPLVERLGQGDRKALAALFELHRDALWRMVRFRMNPRLRTRIDPDDVLQEAFLNAEKRVQHFFEDPSRSAFVWFRLIVEQTLADVHRRHLDAGMRDVRQEIALNVAPNADNTTASIAAGLLASFSTPSHAAIREEQSNQLERALASMSALDREIIALRHFEDLPNAIVAEILKIQPTTASNRYVRALARLKEILAELGYQQ